MIVEIISSILVLLFMYAAISKLIDYSNFKLQLSKSPFITYFSGIIAWALPLFEILLGILLTIRKTRLIGLYISLFIMTLFSAYIYAMLHFSYHLPCSCGGILSRLDWNSHLWFNLLFVLLSLFGIHVQEKMIVAANENRISNASVA